MGKDARLLQGRCSSVLTAVSRRISPLVAVVKSHAACLNSTGSGIRADASVKRCEMG